MDPAIILTTTLYLEEDGVKLDFEIFNYIANTVNLCYLSEHYIDFFFFFLPRMTCTVYLYGLIEGSKKLWVDIQILRF